MLINSGPDLDANASGQCHVRMQHQQSAYPLLDRTSDQEVYLGSGRDNCFNDFNDKVCNQVRRLHVLQASRGSKCNDTASQK